MQILRTETYYAYDYDTAMTRGDHFKTNIIKTHKIMYPIKDAIYDNKKNALRKQLQNWSAAIDGTNLIIPLRCYIQNGRIRVSSK